LKLQQVLDHIDSGDIALPEFQRGYVWNREQVRGLLSSLYRGYPIGGFMTWSTKAEGAAARGGPVAVDGTVKLLLDGQQRVTTLYGVMRGQAPKFFEGNASAFTGLHFNLDEETFEFYAPVKMKDNLAWVNVTTLMQQDVGVFMPHMMELAGGDSKRLAMYVNRLNAVTLIAKVEVHVEDVTGADKTLDVVVDIFNRVNSGGTKLSKGDLALAKICASWPEARQEMNAALKSWSTAGYGFSLDWLLRGVNAVVTGEALFIALADVETPAIQKGLKATTQHLSYLLDIISGRLGLDHKRVLFARFALPVMARYLHQNGGTFANAAERDKLLYWYIHAGMWGRYAGSAETVLNQDLEAVETGGVDALIENLRSIRGDLTVRESDFAGYSIGARFYPMLYLLTRTLGAKDFGSGIPLSAEMLGHLTGLQVHHIFPKAQLYKAGYKQAEINAVANFCFLTQATNLEISDDDPADYFPRVATTQPGALESQWVPMDPSLWRIDRYLDFLEARRGLLAEASNSFLSGLSRGESMLAVEAPSLAQGPAIPAPVDLQDDRAEDIDDLVAWMVKQGYASPETDVEVWDPNSARLFAVAEAFWPNGLQEGIGQPVVLKLDPDEGDEDSVASLGYMVFTTTQGLRDYVGRRASEQSA
jgi:hypothetical protein